jgi:integrase
LKQDKSVKGMEDYAIFRFLYATGLRGSELCNMKWGDIEYDEEEQSYFVNGIGKGSKPFRQEIVDTEAVKAAEKYFKMAFHRKPRLGEQVFWTVPRYKGDTMIPLPYPSLRYRIVTMGKDLRKEGVLKREIEFTPHLLRRSIITNLSKAGMRVKALQNFSRHNSVQTLLKHYVDDEEPAKKYFAI